MSRILAALERHRAGDIEAARPIYREILAAEPANVDALHLLGVAERQSGRPETALDLIGRAISLKGDVPEFHNNLATALQSLGRIPEAIVAFQRALALRAAYFDAAHNLANALAQSDDVSGAVGAYRAAQALRPKDPDVACHLGMALTRLEDYDAAIASFRFALDLRPGDPGTRYELATALIARRRWDEAIGHFEGALAAKPDHAEAHYNLGVALLGAERIADAVASFERAVAVRPTYVDALINLGRALDELGRAEEAVEAYDAALAVEPGRADAHYNRGVVLRRRDDFDGAIASYRQAIAADPRHSKAHYSLGAALFDTGDVEAAIPHYEAAIAAEPGHAYAHLNLAVARLLRGEFAEGWREYEWRWKVLGEARTPFSASEWTGEPLAGRTIVLHAEQGFGDAIQFMRYVPMVAALGGRVVLEIQPELARLAGTLEGPAEIVPRGRPLPPHDLHAPLLGLPRLFETDLTTIPAPGPYLHADPGLAAAWRERIPAGRRRNIAIVWSGNPNHKNDRNRSLDPAEFAPLIAASKARFFSLQLGGRAAPPESVVDLSTWLGDFADTAAALDCLDLLITVDTSIAHLAGALGVPVWVLLPHMPDWRWLQERDDSPWYPSMRLFRQARPGDWEDVLVRVAAELGRRAKARRSRAAKPKRTVRSGAGAAVSP